MKRTLSALISLTLSVSCIAQVNISNDGSITGQLFIDKQGLEYYNSGNIYFENGNYSKADSLFTLALCTYKNEDVYFNRAISKMLLEDTSGYCSDLKISAYAFYDINATKLFSKTCCNKVDTTYYDKKGVLSDKNKYTYLEEVLFLKYEKDTLGFIHHKKSKSIVTLIDYDCDFATNNISFRNTDIVGIYHVHSNVKFFSYSDTPPNYNENFDYKDLQRRYKIAFENKYSNLKASKDEEIILGAEFHVDKIGQISNIKLVQAIPSISDEKVRLEIENDVKKMIQRFPDFVPAKMFNENINYVFYYRFAF